MSIFLKGLERVEKGERFHIDFTQRTMKIGQSKVIDNGEYDISQTLYDENFENPQTLLDKVRELYITYKFSLPSERSDKKRKKYFKALPIDELTDEQLIYGTKREVAQYMLEAFILCAIINGDFVWNDEIYGSWFYQDKLEQDLVILKNWITK
jgi:hypothetical protein